MRASVCLGFAACAIALAACAHDAAKAEATALVSAVDAYRRAGNPDKPNAALAVRAVACSDAQVCDAKAACLAAIDPGANGLALSAEVESALQALEAQRLSPDGAVARELPRKAKEAEVLLARGHDAMPACEQKILIVRIKHDVDEDEKSHRAARAPKS